MASVDTRQNITQCGYERRKISDHLSKAHHGYWQYLFHLMIPCSSYYQFPVPWRNIDLYFRPVIFSRRLTIHGQRFILYWEVHYYLGHSYESFGHPCIIKCWQIHTKSRLSCPRLKLFLAWHCLNQYSCKYTGFNTFIFLFLFYRNGRCIIQLVNNIFNLQFWFPPNTFNYRLRQGYVNCSLNVLVNIYHRRVLLSVLQYHVIVYDNWIK